MGSRINGWGGGVGGGSSIASPAGGIGSGAGIQSRRLTTFDRSQADVPQKGLQLWSMGSNGTRLRTAEVEGGLVTSIRDFSGQNNLLAQSSKSRMPAAAEISGVRAFQFDGSDVTTGANPAAFDFGTGDFTIALASYATTQNGYIACVTNKGSLSTGNGWVVGRNTGRWLVGLFPGGAPSIIQTNSQYSDQWNVVFARRSGTTLQLQVYRGQTLLETRTGTSAAAADGDSVAFGAFFDGSSALNGYIADVLVYNRAIDATERNAVLDYLKGKYA
jgi:hypothetical protein